MVIDDNTLGGGWIPNPNYNKKTKKLGVAPYIQSQQEPRLEDAVANKFYNSNPSLSYVVRDPNTGQVADTSKYIEHGVTPNRIDNLDDLLADNQSTVSKIWNAGKQAIVSNLLLGTVQGFADIAGGLASLAHYVGSGGGDATNDYNNAASDALEKARQEYDANNPVYVRSDANWYDPSSIISHIPAIAGIASMVIPSTGVVKGTSLAGKALGAGRLLTRARLAMTGAKTAKGIKELNEMGSVARAINSVNGVRTANAAAELTANGIVNAAMWSYSEARGVYNEQYANASDTLTRMQKDDPDSYGKIIQNNQEILNGVDTNNPDEVAKRIAGASADTTFGQDMLVNGIFSVMQYYGLRNVWRGIKNGNTTAALKALDRNRRATAGMTEEEAKKYAEKLSFWTNAKNYVGDRMGAAGRLAYSQAVGGLQMGAVSFGHNEGLYYGQVLLNQKPASSFDDRLEKYIKDPATFEETLWGMLAGTAFHFVGSGIKLGINKLETARKKKSMLDKATTEEERNNINKLFSEQYVDAHTRKAALMSTSSDFDSYVSTINKIAHEHKNPFEQDKDGNMKDVEAGSDEETKLLQKAEDNYLTKRIVKSISSGTLNLEKAYMASNEVKDAFVKRGITDANHADEVQQRIIHKMDVAEKAYDNNLNHILTEIGLMNAGRKSEDRVPEIYANQLALENMQQVLYLDSLKNDTNALQQDVNSQIAELKSQNKLNAETDYQEYYNTIVTAEQLGQLYAEKSRLEATKFKDASTLYSLGVVNDRINALEDKVKSTEDASSPTGMARTLWIMNYGHSMEYGDGTNNTEKGKLYVNIDKFNDSSKKFFNVTDGKLVENGDAIANELGMKSYNQEDMPAVRNRYKYYSERFGQLKSSTDAIHNLESELGKNIADKLTTISYNNNEQVMAQHDIAWSRNELAHKFNQYDNLYNEAKKETIQNAIDTILEINGDHFKEGAEAIPMIDYISRYLNGEKVSNLEGLNETEQNRFRDAMNILDLTNVDNSTIVEWLNRSLQFQTFKEIKAKEQAAKDNEEQEKTNKNRKGSQSQQKEQPINYTQDGQQPQGTQGTQPQSETPSPQQSEQTSRPAKVYAISTSSVLDLNTHSKVGTNLIVKEKPSDYNDVDAVRLVDTGDKDEQGNTIYELTSNNTDKGLGKEILNSELFENSSNDLANSIPTDNPLVTVDANGHLNIVTKGQLNVNTNEARSDTDTARQGVVDEGKETQSPSSSTGGEEPAVNTGGIGADNINNGKPGETVSNEQEAYADDDKITEADRKPDVMNAGEGSNAPAKPKAEKVVATEEIDEETNKPVISQLKHEAIVASRDFVKLLKVNGSNTTADAFRKHVYDEIKSKVASSELTDADKSTIDRTVNTFINLAKLSGVTVDNEPTAPTETQRDVADLGLRSSSVDENISNKSNAIDYSQSADRVIKHYSDLVKAETINGKTYIGLEGLLRYCNSIVKDKYVGEVLYDSLVNYLNNDGRNKYTTEDIKLSKDELLVNLQKTQKERLEELSGDTRGSRINFLDTIKTARENDNETEAKAIEHEIDSLQIGDGIDIDTKIDTVNFGHKSYKRRYITFKSNKTKQKNAATLSMLEVPDIDAKGNYSLLVKGWEISAHKSNGTVVSEFAERLKSIINDAYSGDADAKAFTDILVEYRNANANRRKELYKAFEENKVAQQLISDYTYTYKDGHSSFDKASLAHLSNIWNYTRVPYVGATDDSLAFEIQQRQIKDIRLASIDTWAAKLYKSWNDMNTMFENSKNYRARVTKISDGEIILNNANRDAKYEDMTPILGDKKHKAIADNKLSKRDDGIYNDIKIGVGTGTNETEVSGIGTIDTNGINRYSTSLMIKNRDGRWEAVHAFGTRATDATGGGKEIIDAFNNQVHTILQKFHTAKTKDEADTIGKELRALFDDAYYTRFSSLFDGLFMYDENDGNGFTITKKTTDANEQRKKVIAFKFADKFGFSNGRPYIEIREVGKDNKIFVFDESGSLGYAERNVQEGNKRRYGTVVVGNKNADKFYKALDNFINSNTKFNIAPEYIHSDNDGSVELKGLARRKNGKFVLTIGDYEKEFNSYNNFLIDNNLIRVNTHVENGSNYKRIGERSLSGNQVLEVNLEKRPPVEENSKPDTAQSTSKPKTTNAPKTAIEGTLPGFDTPDIVKENVKTIANPNNHYRNTGRTLAKAILGDDLVKQIKSVGGRYSLFPKNVIFSEEFNNIANGHKDDNAATNITDGEVQVGNLRIPPHVTVIGTKFLSYLDNAETRPRAVRILMHEQIHQILHSNGNEKYIRSIQEVYDEFKDAIKDDNSLKKFLFEGIDNNDTRLEEFLVESLTNKQLVDKLNAIQAKGEINEPKKQSLFEKILRVISKVFGWDIKDGSLRAKEIEAFSEALNEIERPKEETKEEVTEDKTSTDKVAVEEKQEQKAEVETKPTDISDNTSVNANEAAVDDEIFDDIEFSSVDDNSLNDNNVPVLNETVTDFNRYNKLSSEQKIAYERLREAGVISITCHV